MVGKFSTAPPKKTKGKFMGTVNLAALDSPQRVKSCDTKLPARILRAIFCITIALIHERTAHTPLSRCRLQEKQ